MYRDAVGGAFLEPVGFPALVKNVTEIQSHCYFDQLSYAMEA